MKKKSIRELNEKQRELLMNESVSPDIVGMLLHMRPADITDIRYRQKFKENINKAARNYRKRLRELEMDKFKKPYGSHNFWSQEEEAEMLTLHFKGLTDKEIAIRLNRSTYSIAKKRERILKDIGYEQIIETAKTRSESTGLTD